MRREIPIMITAIVGMFMILSFFIPYSFIDETAGTIKKWFLLIAAFAIVLGIGNLIRVNLHRIRRRGEDWGYKVVTLVALATFAVIGLVLDQGIDVRSNWVTRGLGISKPDRGELLAGRARLLDRREAAVAVLSGGEPEEEKDKALAKTFDLNKGVQVPDIKALGAAGIRALEPRALHRVIGAARERGASKREILVLEGRLKIAGYGPLVTDLLNRESDPEAAHRELMTILSFTRDQADDLLSLGAAGVAQVSPAELASGMAEVEAEKKEKKDKIRNPSDWIFKFMYAPLQATMFSLLAFFIASAAFRAFRMRSVKAGLLLVAGLLVIVGRVPLGQFDWHISSTDFGFHTIMAWIMNVPNTAAMRGIMMGAAMGVIVMGLKVILGIERSYLGGE